MKVGLLIAMGAAGVASGATWLWRRSRERRERRAWGLLPGWMSRDDIEGLRPMLAMTALGQVGHSRRIIRAVTAPGAIEVFHYACESGFEARRYLHEWLAAVQFVDHGRSTAMFTTQAWLKAVAAEAPMRELPLPDSAGGAARTAIVESPPEWQAQLEGKLGAWLASQPEERAWEVLPGAVAVHEPGRLEVYKAAALAEDVKTFVELIGEASADHHSSSAG